MAKSNKQIPMGESNYPQVPAKTGVEIVNDGANYDDTLEKLIGRNYYNHPVLDIYNKVAQLEGLRFDDDNIITSVKVMVNDMRFVLGFDANLLYALIRMVNPNMPSELLADMCKSACTDLKFKGQPKVLNDAVKELDEEANGEDEVTEASGFVNLTMPRLPKVLDMIVSKYEKPFQEAVLFSSLTFFTAHANDIWVVYNGTELYKILFATDVLGESAMGKSVIDRIKDLIIGDIVERDEIYYEEEQEKKEKSDEPKPRGRKKKGEVAAENADEKEVKHRPIQYLGSTTSITEIAYRTKCVKGLSLIMYDNEGEAMFLSCQRGASTNIWVMLRKGVEGSEYTQGHRGKDTFSGICHPYISHVVCVQPEIALPVLTRQISNGYTSRVFFPEIKQELGARRPSVKSFTDKDIAIIKEASLKLESTHEEGLELKKVNKALAKWLDERAMEAIQKCSYAVDHYRKRAASTAYKAAALYYFLDGQRETKHTVEFALYCAEYMLRKQLYYFGDEYNRIKKESRKGGITTNNVNYYEKLSDEFTADELVELRRSNGESTNVRMIISRWRKAGIIEDVEGKRATYRKVHHD